MSWKLQGWPGTPWLPYLFYQGRAGLPKLFSGSGAHVFLLFPFLLLCPATSSLQHQPSPFPSERTILLPPNLWTRSVLCGAGPSVGWVTSSCLPSSGLRSGAASQTGFLSRATRCHSVCPSRLIWLSFLCSCVSLQRECKLPGNRDFGFVHCCTLGA